MVKQGRGFGLVVLAVVMVIVLFLAAKAWERYGPTAVDVSHPGAPRPHGQPEAAEALRDMPDLGETQQRTDEHRAQVEEALENLD